MVWGVCCRLLHKHRDAEDAFQATFLVLVRKSADVPGQAVANWLYGVARQTAVRLRATTWKHGRRESHVANMLEPNVAEMRATELKSVLDEELDRLPGHYRGVLCDLAPSALGLGRSYFAGSNNSTGLPSGSSTWICLPPGPFSISLRKRSPAFFSASTRVGRSSTSRTIRFHPPGSCLRPSGNGRAPELFGPLSQRVRLPFETAAKGGPAG